MRQAWLCGWIICSLAAAAGGGEDFSGKDLEKRDFSDKNLEGANFEDANCNFAKFNRATLTGANFKEADLTNADFGDAELEGADFRGAVLASAFFQRANLVKANFEGVNLENMSFQNCKMKGANLRNAKRIGDVQKTDLRNADLRGAVFTCTDYYMGGARLQGAKYDKNTRWPKGFDFEASGAVLDNTPSPADPKSDPSAPRDPKSSDTPKPPGERPKTPAPKIPDLKAAKLTEEIVKHRLETEMWGSKDGKGFTYEYRLLKLEAPRKESGLRSGIRFLEEIVVIPVEVQCDVIKDLGNNDTSKTEKHQDYVFFKDDNGLWTYRFKGNR